MANTLSEPIIILPLSAESPFLATGLPCANTVGDPLLRQGLEKRSAQIGVEGPFVQVLAFLQALEKLEVFVVTDDLSVRVAPTSEDEAIKVRLRLTLLAYGAIKSR